MYLCTIIMKKKGLIKISVPTIFLPSSFFCFFHFLSNTRRANEIGGYSTLARELVKIRKFLGPYSWLDGLAIKSRTIRIGQC